MDIKQILREHLLKEATGLEYGAVMVYIPMEKEWWDNVTSKIDEDDVYDPEGDRDYGIQPHNEAHVTILYGLHNDIPDSKVENLISKMSAPDITLKHITIFENPEFDVVKFDVEGEGLHDMNNMFSKLPHTTDYPDYHPHCTIAYVNAGTGKKYKKKLSEKDMLTLKPSKVVYSMANGKEKEYKLK